jgi:SAM-dependent methyltransferase
MIREEYRLGLTEDNNYYRLPDLEGRRVLEVGCNVGLLARHIIRHCQPAEYLGMDAWHAPEQTPELAPRFRTADVQRRDTLPFDRPWDVVICFDVLYHLLSPLEALRNLHDLAGECLVLGTAVLPEGKILNRPDAPLDYHYAEGPLLRFEPGFRGDDTNYLFPTEECLRRMLTWAGFPRLERKYYYREARLKGFCDRTTYHCWKTG